MSNDSKPLNAVLGRVASIALAIAGTALVGMAAVEAWQVFARYVLNDSPSWTEPVALLLMSTTMMLGAAAGVRANRHFGFFIVVDHVKPPVQRVLRTIARLIGMAIGLMFATWGGDMLIDAWDFPMAGAPLPQGVVFMPMCIGGALIAVFFLEQLISPPPVAAHVAE
ncbi:MAG TPA: TRAP transporter small permease [Povalibacter sp.]|nr:TRAP transporter small permease [Povalibacter sp.]